MVHAVCTEARELACGVAELFSSGRVVDLILLFVAGEAILLIACRRHAGPGTAAVELAVCILPGLMLMLALRAALVGAAWPWIAMSLLGALVAHLADLHRRLVARPSGHRRRADG